MIFNRWSILALLVLVRTGTGIQYQTVASLSPLLMSDYSLGIADIGLLIGLYHAPGTILAFPGGAIGARLGDKRLVLTGLVLMAAAEFMMPFGPTWPAEMGARILAGTGGILLNVMMLKMVADWFAGKETATAMGIIGNAAPAGIALALVTIPSIAEMGGRTLASAATLGYLALAFASMALAYRAPAEVAAVARQQKLWPQRRVALALATAGMVYGIYNVGLTTILAYGPLMLAERGWTFAAASSVTSLVLWIVTVSLPGGGYLADRTGQRALVLVGGLLAFAAAMALAPRVDDALPVFILLGIASGLPCGVIMSLPTQVLSPATRAAGMGILLTVYYVMNVCGPWAVGRIAELSGSPRFAFDVSALSLCGAIAFWLIFRRLANGTLIAAEAKAVS